MKATMDKSYLFSKTAECYGVLAPPILITLVVVFVEVASPNILSHSFPNWMWLLVVVGIDVAHVWSTIFKTYLSPVARERFPLLLFLAPLIAWLGGVTLYATCGGALFWSCFAYLAVFHFVRQQYGIYSLYARKVSSDPRWLRELNIAAVYLAAIYPLLFWHTHLPRDFHWFVEGDFSLRIPLSVSVGAGCLFALILGAHVLIEGALLLKGAHNRLPKNLVVWGTAVAWYVGIVLNNSDLPFTVTNVVTHGVPYFTLLWLFERKARSATTLGAHVSHREPSFTDRLFLKGSGPLHSGLGVIGFVGIAVGLAFVEEWAWDVFIWRDHPVFFGLLWGFPHITDPRMLSLIVPLLSIPQATHYIVDGFIWRVKRG